MKTTIYHFTMINRSFSARWGWEQVGEPQERAENTNKRRSRENKIIELKENRNLTLRYWPKPLWDPVRGLLLVRYLLAYPSSHKAETSSVSRQGESGRSSEDRKELEKQYWEMFLTNYTNLEYFANVAQLLHPADYTIPPQFVRLRLEGSERDIIVNVKVSMPRGEIPKPLFESILVYMIRGLSRLRWGPKEWLGMAYGLYKMSATNTGIVLLDPIIRALILYLARFWSSLICNSLVFEYYHGFAGAASQYPLNKPAGVECEKAFYEALRSLEEWYMGMLPAVPELPELQSRRGEERGDVLASRIRALRDLFYISMMIGKLNLIAPVSLRTHGILVISKQSWIERLNKAGSGEEPSSVLFNLLFGDPMGLAVNPVITTISRVYGGGLWQKVPRLFSPKKLQRDGQRLSFIEDILSEREAPPDLDPSMRVQGVVEASLFAEAIDVYTSSVFFIPWERASAVTLLLRMLGRGLKKLRGLGGSSYRKSNDDFTEAFRQGVVAAYTFDENKVIALPLSLTSTMKGEKYGTSATAVVYRQRLLHLAAQDLETVSSKLLEAKFAYTVDYITKTLRSHVASVTQEVDDVIMRNYEKYMVHGQPSPHEIGFTVKGIGVEVLNPIIDLVPDPRGLERVLASSETSKLWLIKALIDRLADSEYTRVFIYYIIEINNIGLIYNKRIQEKILSKKSLEYATPHAEFFFGYRRWRKIHDNHPQYLTDMRELVERVLELHDPLRKFTENVHMDLANMGYVPE